MQAFPFLTAIFCLFLLAGNAHAYLDPGTGSAILQGVLAAFAALAVTAKLYWHRLLQLLGIRKKTPRKTADEKMGAAAQQKEAEQSADGNTAANGAATQGSEERS